MRRANMQPHTWFLDGIELLDYRHTIETVNSQCGENGSGAFVCGNILVHCDSLGQPIAPAEAL